MGEAGRGIRTALADVRHTLLPPLPELEGPAWREFTLLGLTLVVVFVACYQPLWDPDSFWHLAIGREIWRTGHLVRTETFSFTANGVPWEDTEWLFHFMVYPLWKVFGYAGLSFFTALMGLLIASACYRVVRLAGGNAMVFSLFLLLLLGCFRSRVRLRPDLFSLLLMAALMEGLLRWRPRPPRVGRFWVFLALLFGLWAQLHGGWSYGLALLGVVLAGMALDSIREATFSLKYAVNLGLTGLAPVAALFANPYGWKIPWFPVKSLVGFSDPKLIQIIEWNRTPWLWPFSVFIVVGLLLILLLLLAWRRLTWSTILWAGSQVFLGLYWSRYVTYGVVGLMPAAGHLSKSLPRRGLLHRALWGIALAWALSAGAISLARMPREMDLSHKYPVQETAFLVKNKVSGNLFNTYVAGGFLDWYAYPLDRVFMDGRYYPFADTLKDYWSAHKTTASYEAFLGRYPFDIALYPHPTFLLKGADSAPGSPLRGPSTILFPKDRWALVAFGNYGMVLIRRRPRYEEVIRRYEYRLLRSDDTRYLKWAATRGLVDSRILKTECRRALKDHPYGSRASLLKETVAFLEKIHGAS